MKIHVNKNGTNLGPYSADEILSRVSTGEFLPTDLGWHAGLSVWTPLSLILATQNQSSHATPPLPLSNREAYAGFWFRVLALIIDYIALLVPSFAIGFVLGAIMGREGASVSDIEVVANLFGIVFAWLYYACMESSPLQATLGKLALGLRVTDECGQRISFGRATGRHFGKIVSGITLCIGFIMTGFTARKQALHDLMAGCLVCRK